MPSIGWIAEPVAREVKSLFISIRSLKASQCVPLASLWTKLLFLTRRWWWRNITLWASAGALLFTPCFVINKWWQWRNIFQHIPLSGWRSIIQILRMKWSCISRKVKGQHVVNMIFSNQSRTRRVILIGKRVQSTLCRVDAILNGIWSWWIQERIKWVFYVFGHITVLK